MQLRLRDLIFVKRRSDVALLPPGKVLINTINAHSYNTAQNDRIFAESLTRCDYLLPDGVSIVIACRLLHLPNRPEQRVTGWDLFTNDMRKLNQKGGKAMFVGSSEKVLERIRKKSRTEYPNITVSTYSPPFKDEFSAEEDNEIIQAINDTNPDLLWIGMTAPKQEKWIYSHWNELNIHCHTGSIGAVFDYFAGTYPRAPYSWQSIGLEWLFRLLLNPRKMWRRYIFGNPLFVWNVVKQIRLS